MIMRIIGSKKISALLITITQILTTTCAASLAAPEQPIREEATTQLPDITRGFSSSPNNQPISLQAYLKNSLENRIHEMIRFIEVKTPEQMDFFFSFCDVANMAKTTQTLPECTEMTQPDLIELALAFVKNELNQRLQNLVTHIETTGIVFRKYRNNQSSSTHAWPCTCKDPICVDGLNDFVSYQKNLDAIIIALMHFMALIEATNQSLVKAEQQTITLPKKNQAAYYFAALSSVGKFFNKIDKAISTCQIRP